MEQDEYLVQLVVGESGDLPGDGLAVVQVRGEEGFDECIRCGGRVGDGGPPSLTKRGGDIGCRTRVRR